MKVAGLALLLLVCACGPPPSAHTPWEHQLSPLPAGAEWDYRVVDANGKVSARAMRVVGSETLDGQTAILVDTSENGVTTRTWLRRNDLVLILQQQVEDPGAPTTLEHFDPGEPWGPDADGVSEGQTFSAAWTQSPSGAGKLSETWTVQETKENLTVDAGTFKAVRLLRERSDGTTETLWFATGVGLLKTDGAAERLTLLAFSFP